MNLEIRYQMIIAIKEDLFELRFYDIFRKAIETNNTKIHSKFIKFSI